MTYISLSFFVLVFCVFLAYYILPMRYRWISLLTGSMVFYFLACKQGIGIMLITAAVSFLVALILEKGKISRKITLILGIIAVSIPWFLIKNVNTLITSFTANDPISWIVPMGISFYTLQLISYMVDVYKGKINAQKNPFKYLLFVTFFPQILQGPIPRYEKLSKELYEGHMFDEDEFMHGVLLIAWGFFLKMMIADKSAVIVNEVFNNYEQYRGAYVLVAGVLYSFQLYADFSACISISLGVSRLFGIHLDDNFMQPYFSVSVKDFWRRWHISLSSWLRDYIYIPLGGSRKGTVRKYINLVITFIVSGIWHGAGLNFMVWGLLHAVYQIVGELTKSLQDKCFAFCGLSKEKKAGKFICTMWTFLCVTVAWTIFRAQTFAVSIKMLVSIFTIHNVWILTDDTIFNLGLSQKEWFVLIISLVILYIVSKKNEKHEDVAKEIISLPLVLRWVVLLVIFFGIMTFGTYGMGYNAQDFIYGGF